MALGSAKVMGIKLMVNFNRPYFSKNIQEFWKRWHISLSTWFRDYLYIPLGGNRVPKWRVYLNVAIVFIVSGFWHGANWTFVIWGAIHAFLVISHMLYRSRFKEGKTTWLGDAFSIIVTFILVSLAWVFFRADNVHDAFSIISKMLHSDLTSFRLFYGEQDKFGYISALIALVMIVFMFINERIQNVLQTTLNNKPVADIVFNSFLIFAIISLGIFQRMSFIYFQF